MKRSNPELLVSDFFLNDNLIQYEIKNKESYLSDLLNNIDCNLTGRIDSWNSNMFIRESVQLLKNSITLFELGYFDSSYYSLRQSLEVSTTMIYLSELDGEKRKDEIDNWKNERHFPMFTQMVKYLNKNVEDFRDFKTKLNDHFQELEKVKRGLNKIVHKQGFDKFYLYRKFHRRSEDDKKKFENQFEKNFEFCLSSLSIMRLMIDPFPILLQEEEIHRRTPQLLSVPYNTDFTEKYLGSDVVEMYKKTNIYKGHYEHFMTLEPMNDTILDIVKDNYINLDNVDEIESQIHLLSNETIIVLSLILCSENITTIYVNNGLMVYFTNRKSDRKKWGFDGREFMSFKDKKIPYNIPYDESFISYVYHEGSGNEIEDDFFVQHNSKISNTEFESLQNVLKKFFIKPTDI